MKSEPLWLSVARMTKDIAEIPGPQSTQAILNWAKDIGALAYVNDDIAWCAVYLNRLMLACQLPLSGIGYDLLRAKSFLKWGVKLDTPSLGCVQVFDRPGGAHVGLYLGESATKIRTYGGNVANRVGIAWLAKARLLGNRWPVGVPLPTTGVVTLTDAGDFVSMDEK